MDHDLVAFTGHEDHQLEQVASGVGPDDEPSVRVLIKVFDRK